MHKMADRLYSNLQAECDCHISAQLARLAGEQTMDPVLFLEKVRAACNLLRNSILSWTSREAAGPLLGNRGKCVLLHSSLVTKLTTTVCDQPPVPHLGQSAVLLS